MKSRLTLFPSTCGLLLMNVSMRGESVELLLGIHALITIVKEDTLS